MPNRIIREGYLDSPRVAQLDALAERFYFRMFLIVDDYGRIENRPELLKSWCFPVREDVRAADISRWTSACEAAGLFLCYEVCGRRYIQLQEFNQRTRTDSKFPAPPGSADIREHSRAKDGLGVVVVVSEGVVEAPAAREDLPAVLDTNDFRAAWERWKKHRAEKRSKLTPMTTKEQLKKLAAWGPDKAIAALENAIEKGWIGVFEPDAKLMPNPAKPRPQLPSAETVLSKMPSVSESQRAAQRAAFERQIKTGGGV